MHYVKFNGIASLESVINQMPMLLLMTAVPSIAEDILTRGYLFAHLKTLKPAVWVLLSSVIYLLNHIWRLDDGFAVLTYLFILGVVLAVAVCITKSLWLAFGIHWGANIAFESTNSIINLETLKQHDGSTWLLSISWALLLIILLSFKFVKDRKLI
jgi:membrane protease YdiL (CAAX protease family)